MGQVCFLAVLQIFCYSPSMAHPIRIEYPGAVYQVTSEILLRRTVDSRTKGQRVVVLVWLSALMLFVFGCTAEPGLDKKKFAELDRAAQDLKAAVKSGKACETQDTLLKRFVSGTEALKDKMASDDERALLEAFSHLVTTYQDNLLLCRTQTAFAGFEFVPKGRIYVTQELDPLVEKYHLPIKQHVYKPTGKNWKSIPDGAVQVVWEQMAFEIKNIESRQSYTYN